VRTYEGRVPGSALMAIGVCVVMGWPALTRANALYEAIEKGNVEQARDILRISAEQVNTIIYKGECSIKEYTPLGWAVEFSQYAMVEFLIEQGAKIDAKCEWEYHEPAFGAACMPSATSSGYESPLTLAIDGKKLKIAQLLVEKGADLELLAPLRHAIRGADKAGLDFVRLLVMNGANVDGSYERKNDGKGGTVSPIELGIDEDSLEVVSYLLSEGAYPNGLNEKHTALEYALSRKRPSDSIALALLSAGASPWEHRDKTWPLATAVRAGLHRTVAEMVEKQSVPIDQLPSNILLTLLDDNCGLPCWATGPHLLQGNTKQCEAGHMDDAAEGCFQVFGYLVKKGFGLNGKDEKGNTPVHLAITKNRAELVRILLESNPELLNARNSEFFTPLGIAIKWGNGSIEKYLRELGGKE